MSLEAFPVVVMKQSFTEELLAFASSTDASLDEERVLQCRETKFASCVLLARRLLSHPDADAQLHEFVKNSNCNLCSACNTFLHKAITLDTS